MAMIIPYDNAQKDNSVLELKEFSKVKKLIFGIKSLFYRFIHLFNKYGVFNMCKAQC